METPAVPGTTDQVDLNVNVTEKSTGSIQFGAGVSSTEGVVLSVVLTRATFLVPVTGLRLMSTPEKLTRLIHFLTPTLILRRMA